MLNNLNRQLKFNSEDKKRTEDLCCKFYKPFANSFALVVKK